MIKVSLLNIEKLFLTININFFRKTQVKHADNAEIIYAKRILCSQIDAFYMFSDCEFENFRDFQKKSRIVLKTMRGLIREFPCKNVNEISYLAENFGISRVLDNDGFYDELLKKEWNLKEDSVIFNTGLRSISAILSWNIEKVSIDRIISVKENLKPIVSNFKRKEELING